MTRRFNVESLHAAGVIVRAGEAAQRCKSDRAANLMLSWWAFGFDPRRHVLACYVCGGVGHRGHTCSHCRGTGRRP